MIFPQKTIESYWERRAHQKSRIQTRTWVTRKVAKLSKCLPVSSCAQMRLWSGAEDIITRRRTAPHWLPLWPMELFLFVYCQCAKYRYFKASRQPQGQIGRRLDNLVKNWFLNLGRGSLFWRWELRMSTIRSTESTSPPGREGDANNSKERTLRMGKSSNKVKHVMNSIYSSFLRSQIGQLWIPNGPWHALQLTAFNFSKI